MKTLSLTGTWKFKKSNEREWLTATVPGGVHTDLLALKRIPDPFVGDNEKKVAWVAESDWDYARQFTVTPDFLNHPNIWLVCDGLDTLATVKLNGTELGKTANMFRQYRWDVKNLLVNGKNELIINFASPVKYCAEKQARRFMAGVSQAIPGGPHLRKAPCQFGWDWGPQLPPIGIWKDIRLEAYEGARLENVHLRQIHKDGQVTVEATLKVEAWQKGSYIARMLIHTPNCQTLEVNGEVAGDSCKLSLNIRDPQLWWPNGYGEQPLYDVNVELLKADVIFDTKSFKLGLRTLELRQQPDEWGKTFEFVVNGLRIPIKGSDWIPADSFPTRITNEYLEMLLKAAVDTHQNMLRVWGGGFYEEDRFYDLCDKYGILIWQDFIFACSVYPWDEPEFVENFRVEAIENIRRLRHRASLALWCGNNEMEQGWVEWGWKTPEMQALKPHYDTFYHKTLPAWVAAEDPDRPYWPSSPSSGIPFEAPNGQQQGDAHFWDVWHGRKPFTAYRASFPRFMSEFGFQALPPMETIKTYAEPEDWNMTSYIMEQHQKNDAGNQIMVTQMLDTFNLPKDFESLVYLTLVLQAEGIRYGVEHWRRFPKRTAGIIYWQLNDCWPVASWSSLDYFGRWKALHYAARRFYAPLLLSVEDKPTEQDVFITNESREPWQGSVRWTLERFDGKTLKKGEEPASVPAFDAVKICHCDFADILTDELSRELVFVAEQWKDGRFVARQTSFFRPTKHLNLVDPRISARPVVEMDTIRIDLSAKSLARQVELKLDGADVVFSDNYFDLPAGRNVTITAPLPRGWKLDRVKKALRIRSVYDSFAHAAAK